MNIIIIPLKHHSHIGYKIIVIKVNLTSPGHPTSHNKITCTWFDRFPLFYMRMFLC